MSFPEEFENNFIIISGSQEFKVDKFQIASRMIRFKKDTNLFLSGIYQIKSKVNDSVVDKFIEAAKTGKCPEFTIDNVPSYQQLSLEFEFNSLFHACNSFILSQKDLPTLISNLLSPSYKSSEISDKEATLNAIEIAFAYNLTQDHINKLKSLPNSVLYKILSNPSRPRNQNEKNIYDIIKTKIEHGDHEANFLLQAINYSSISHNDLSMIMSFNKKPKNHNKQQQQQQPQPQSTQSTTPTLTPSPSSPSSTSQSQTSKEKPDKNPNTQTSAHKPKVARVSVSNRAASTTNMSDEFQAVYIPENSDIKQVERRALEIINTRRSRDYPLTINQEISSKLQSHYGSSEEVKPPSDTDYLILRDRFIFDVDRRHLFLALEENENKLYDSIKQKINEIPIEDISNSNFLALSIIKFSGGFYCAFILGNAECGRDQIDPNPPNNTSSSNANLPSPSIKQISSAPNVSLDLIESVKSAFYQTDQSSNDIYDIFFNEEYSSQLMNFLERIEKSNEKVTPDLITQNVSGLKGYQIFYKFNNQINPILDSIKNLNKHKNGCIIALAVKKTNNRFICFMAYVMETFSPEQKELITTMKSINFNGKYFIHDIYKTLVNFISSSKDLPETGDPIDSLTFNENQYKYIFLKGQNLNDVLQKITGKYRNRIKIATKVSSAVKKVGDNFQLMIVFWKNEQ